MWNGRETVVSNKNCLTVWNSRKDDSFNLCCSVLLVISMQLLTWSLSVVEGAHLKSQEQTMNLPKYLQLPT